METIQAFWDFIIQSLLPHWPGLFFILLVTVVAQTLKSRVLTKSLAKKSKFIFYSRRVYPIFLLFLGIIPGLFWSGDVYPGVDTTFEKILYFMGCSGISILGFNIFKQWVKKKYDIDIEEVVDEAISTPDKEESSENSSGNCCSSDSCSCDKVREGEDTTS